MRLFFYCLYPFFPSRYIDSTHFAPLLLRLYPHRGSHTNSITRGRESMLSLSLARSLGSPKIDKLPR
ncbi:hypothetical protein BDQ94DRAFT_133442 [Aspergillus welwitschiae]|uniref:Uncharacterized protein n=1 Tax=Aspergillus welwitschiae TaxID=1341132 RepID=A0A3F3QK42_9EURO|nr:hypothetical protein BDQ94DRAFT_133442 [Aspergillus welwitschiae]RDH39653.1 hypothetical protein BDQ94DRAFT_133442 [Aspergillus welwitschiae]